MEVSQLQDPHHDIEREADYVERLTSFRKAVGIVSLTDGKTKPKKRNTNVGIYRRVVEEEYRSKIKYHLTATLITACLILQLIFAAVVTALGASESSHIIITVFGALNTVIAGILSITRGQNLPNRFRQYENALRKVREHIELRERDFSLPDCKLDLHKEIRIIVDMYEAARQTEELNDPNAYVEPGKPYMTGQKTSAFEKRQSTSSDSDKSISVHHKAKTVKGKSPVSDQTEGAAVA